MFNDARSGKVILVAHCLLNQNSIVPGLARYGAIVKKLIDLLIKYNLGVIQLPCPEMLHCGLLRWWMTREQYDNPGFRSLCRRLSKQILDYVVEYTRSGVRVIGLIGIAGSPSCGVYTTSAGWRGGEPSTKYSSRRVEGRGVFMDVLLSMLKQLNIQLEVLVEYDYSNEEESIRRIEFELQKTLKHNLDVNTK